ncbi:MAG: GNAT family N-acetyltransferase [Rhizobiales bacterium]|nr:GNAT family N-acetyltransferase [Hyphomicrobiales bacterium]
MAGTDAPRRHAAAGEPGARAPTIRPLALADRSAWQPLWDGYLTFYRQSLAPEVTDHVFARLCSGDPSFVGLVAENDGGGLTGLAHYVIHPSTWSMTSYCYLEDLFVDPDVRGRGIARALIEAVRQRAVAERCDRLYWATQEFNYRGRTLYDKVAARTPFILYEIAPPSAAMPGRDQR